MVVEGQVFKNVLKAFGASWKRGQLADASVDVGVQ